MQKKKLEYNISFGHLFCTFKYKKVLFKYLNYYMTKVLDVKLTLYMGSKQNNIV